METQNRRTAAGLNQPLHNIRSFSFFQLADLLRRFAAQHNQIEETQVQVRYRAMPSLAFPPADVNHCEFHAMDDRQFLDVTVTFMGLFGPASPLPAFYTERVIQTQHQNGPSRDLMDIFNHRCISLLQVCWEKYRYYIQYQTGGTDQYSHWLLSLLGIDSRNPMPTMPLQWHRLLPFAGLLANNVCSTDLLTRIIAHYFSLPQVHIKPWAHRKILIAEDQITRVGVAQCMLGQDLVLGDSVTDVSGKFVLHLSQLSNGQYRNFLPGTPGYRELVALIRFLLKDPLTFDLHLECKTGQSEAVTPGDARLGWNHHLGEVEVASATVICVDDFACV